MARGVTVATERRAGTRVLPQQMSWPGVARLRPGQDVLIVNLSAGGTLVESSNLLKPGARAELHFRRPAHSVVRGRIARCRVIGIEPMMYEAAITFDESLAGLGGEHRSGEGSSSEGLSRHPLMPASQLAR